MKSIDKVKLSELRKEFGGEILVPGDQAYEAARRIWNGMIDKHPAVIARCKDATDVSCAVNFARDHGLALAVRGGGHNIAGSALVEDGLVVDLSQMKGVRVDAAARRAFVQGGATLADLDAATQAHGLATPVGINSTTGVAGLTLGGGFGWLSRKYGMTVDNLLSAEVVTAEGGMVRASEKEHPDLFWALRGGSGNFGVVTEFEFRLHPVGPQVLTGLVVYPLAQAKTVLQKYREFMATAPDELTVWSVLRLAPPLPFLPAEVHGKPVIVLAFSYIGDAATGEAMVQPLRRFGVVAGEFVGAQPFAAWQQAFDPLLTTGARNYWKSHNLTELSDGLIDATLAALDKLPSPQCEVFIAALGGATTRPQPDATAYAHRATRFVLNVHSRWDAAADDRRCIDWARDFFQSTAKFATGGVYVNFMSDDEADRVSAAYGSNFPRLVEVKRKFDPNNLFSTNQNIRPA